MQSRELDPELLILCAKQALAAANRVEKEFEEFRNSALTKILSLQETIDELKEDVEAMRRNLRPPSEPQQDSEEELRAINDQLKRTLQRKIIIVYLHSDPIICVAYLLSNIENIDFGVGISMKSRENAALYKECHELCNDLGTVPQIDKVLNSLYHAMKNTKKRVQKHGGDEEASKKEESRRAAKSHRVGKRKSDFEDLYDKGDSVAREFNYQETVKVLACALTWSFACSKNFRNQK
jgi:hypothetical protein